MLRNLEVEKYERIVTPPERIFMRSPYAIVAVIARIKGKVSENMVKDAVSKVQQRHTNLRVRIIEDDNHIPRFTSEGVKEIPIEVVPRESDDHWILVYHEACKVPFEFEERPAIRFILIQSSEMSDLVIFCHHVICDGMSLAYLARDLMVHLGEPNREVELLPDPVPMDRDTLPEEVSLNAIARFFIKRINKKWEKDRISFDQEDYRNLNEAYWKNFKHQMMVFELSEAQTSALVQRCRKEGVTVNTALVAAFAGAQHLVQDDKSYHPRIAVAGNLRDRLQRPAGEAMGFYAGGVTLKFKYNSKRSFWENARKVHKNINPLYTDRKFFNDAIAYCYLEPGIIESLSFKMIGGLVPSDSTRYEKINAFSKQNDVVLSILKREKMDSLDKPILGTAVTNLTRLDFPTKYGILELDRLIMNPGGAFPLVHVLLVIGAVTCAGKLSLLLEYAEEAVDTEIMEKINDKAMEFLFNGIES